MILLVLPLLPIARGRRLLCLKCFAIAAVVSGATMIPWAIHGHRVSGSIVMPTTGGGLNLYSSVLLGHYGDYEGNLRQLMSKKIYPDIFRVIEAEGVRENSQDFMSEFMWTFKDLGDEVRADRILKRKAIEAIGNDPARFLAGQLRNLPGFWFRGWTVKESQAAVALNAPLLVLVLAGAVSVIRLGRLLIWPLLLMVLSFNLAYVMGVPNMRYSAPIVPLVIVLAAQGFYAIGALLNPRWRSSEDSSFSSVERESYRE
jgi:hypothetical protein